MAVVLFVNLGALLAQSPTGPFAVHPQAEADPPLALAHAERVYLAEIEHRGLVLSRKGFPAIAAAIRSGDPTKLAHLLSETFRGEIIDPEHGTAPGARGVRLHRLLRESHADAPARSVDARTFAEHLAALRRQFEENVSVELALQSLAPVARERLEGAWQGSCALRLVGAATSGGRRELLFKLNFRLTRIPDLDVIADTPGWIDSLAMIEAQAGTVASPLMSEVATHVGIDTNLFTENWSLPVPRRGVVTGGVYLADIDNDGWDELLITDLKGTYLFKRLGDGRFEEITEPAGLRRSLGPVANAVFADFDNDGWVDLILNNRIFRNNGKGVFADATAASNLRLSDPRLDEISGYSVGDYNRDGLVDLYVARSHGPMPEGKRVSWIDGPGGPGNQLWKNLGRGQFADVSKSANATAGNRSCFTSAWLDANNDGWPDIYAINEFGGGVLLVNRTDGTFREMPLVDDAGDFGSMGLAVGDYNNDGHIDIYTANMYSKSGRRVMENLAPGSFPPDVFVKMKRFVTGSELYRNRGGLHFERAGKDLRVHAVGWSYGPTFADFDNDGFLDIYATAGFFSVNKEEPDG